jgi:hypothetical protein
MAKAPGQGLTAAPSLPRIQCRRTFAHAGNGPHRYGILRGTRTRIDAVQVGRSTTSARMACRCLGRRCSG